VDADLENAMADVIDTTDFRKGLKIEVEGDPFEIIEFQHVKPGKGGAFVRTRIKSLLTGNTLDRTFRAGDKVGRPDIDEREMQYLYAQGDEYYFMDSRSYEQTFITAEILGEARNFLKENIVVSVLLYRGKALGVSLPNTVDLKVTTCDPGVRGDTVSGATKPATMETGYVVNVPLFINEGDVLRIDTRTGEFKGRIG
jgi:elongation factor P